MVFMRLVRSLETFGRNVIGGTGIAFAIAVLPVAFATGAAVDYGSASFSRQELDRAADAATMAGVRATSASMRQSVALSTFNGLAATVGSATISNVVVSSADGAAVELRYTANVPTTLLRMSGIKSVTIGGRSVATSASTGFSDYYILFDISASMGMGATPADTTKMINLLGCALACHMAQSPADNTYPRARDAGINTRIDATRSAIAALISILQSANTGGRFRVGLYPFVKKMKPLFALSSNLSAALTATQKIELDVMTDADLAPGGTSVELPISQLNALISRNGDGSTASNAKTFVLLVTDGMDDEQGYLPYVPQWTDQEPLPPRIHAIDPKACLPLKNKGVSVGVLNLKYGTVTGPTDWSDQDKVANAAIPSLASALKQCASDPKLYFEATYSDDIDVAFRAYVNNTLSSTPHFIQ